MKTEELKLGSLITIVDERNSDAKELPLLGINLNKDFFPSVANVIGTDLSKYKLLKSGRFACNLMHVGRDGKVPIALYRGEDAIVSPAYPMFEVKDENILLPDYLMLLFKRDIFDKEATFYASAGIRGGFEMDDFLNVPLPVPPIEEQRRIVSEYQTIEHRIANNEALIQKLEETAQTIYYHTFVEGIDEENLPSGWKKETADNLFNITIGKTPPREEVDCFVSNKSGVKWVSIADMKSLSPFILSTKEELTKEAIKTYNVKLIPEGTILCSFKMTVGRVSITTETMCTNEAIAHFCTNDKHLSNYIYYYLKYFDYNTLGSTSSITEAVNSKIIKQMPIILPPNDTLIRFYNDTHKLLTYELAISKENTKLNELLTIHSSKLS